MKLHVDVIRDDDGFQSIGPEWSELLDSSPAGCLFLTWDWLHTWWRLVAPHRRLFLVTVRAGDQLVGLAPFMVRPSSIVPFRPLATLEFLGSGEVGSDYLDVIVREGFDPSVRRALAEFLVSHAVMLDLPRVVPAGVVAGGLASALESHGWTHAETQSDVCPIIRLAGHSWDSFLGGLGAQHRYNFRRRLKNAGRAHEVRLTTAGSDLDRRDALATLIELHNSRWASRGGSSAFHTAALRQFHEAITAIALAHGWLRLYTLWFDDTPVASLYGFVYRRTFSFYQSGFDVRYNRDSVGLLAMGLAIQRAIGEGVEVYDFLHGSEDYKFLWTCEVRPLVRLQAFPPRVRGLLCRAAWDVRRRAARVAQRVRRRSTFEPEVSHARSLALVTPPR